MRRGRAVITVIVCAALGCGTLLSVDEDEEKPKQDPASSSSSSSTSGESVSTTPSTGQGSADGDGGLGIVDASSLDADATTCVTTFNRCVQASECCNRGLPGPTKEVCRSSPRVCDKCVPLSGECKEKTDCCAFNAKCTNGVCIP